MAFKRTYKFAFLSALILSFLATAILFGLDIYYNIELPFGYILFFFSAFLLVSLLIIQNRVQQFIYKKVQKIYDDVSLLDITDVDKKKITSDMDVLSKKVNEFAEGKRLEIETLQLREA